MSQKSAPPKEKQIKGERPIVWRMARTSHLSSLCLLPQKPSFLSLSDDDDDDDDGEGGRATTPCSKTTSNGVIQAVCAYKVKVPSNPAANGSPPTVVCCDPYRPAHRNVFVFYINGSNSICVAIKTNPSKEL